MHRVPPAAGEVDVDDLGTVHMHEHVFIGTEVLRQSWPGFGGWTRSARSRPRA